MRRMGRRLDWFHHKKASRSRNLSKLFRLSNLQTRFFSQITEILLPSPTPSASIQTCPATSVSHLFPPPHFQNNLLLLLPIQPSLPDLRLLHNRPRYPVAENSSTPPLSQ